GGPAGARGPGVFRRARCRLAQARHGARPRDRDRSRLRDAWPHRLRGTLRLRGARAGHEPRLTPQLGRRGRPEPRQSAHYAAVDQLVEAAPLGELELKGFVRPVAAYEVHRLITT